MTHKEYYTEIKRLFPIYADQEIIIDIMESQMIPQNIAFNKMYHLYQYKHYKKYGEYLQITIKK